MEQELPRGGHSIVKVPCPLPDPGVSVHLPAAAAHHPHYALTVTSACLHVQYRPYPLTPLLSLQKITDASLNQGKGLIVYYIIIIALQYCNITAPPCDIHCADYTMKVTKYHAAICLLAYSEASS